MNTISFQVSKAISIEPDQFTFGLVVESEDVPESLSLIDSIVSGNDKIKKINLDNHDFTISARPEDLDAVLVFQVSDRDELKLFAEQLRQIKGIQGGIIRTEIAEEEQEELKLIKLLSEEARAKAYKYAEMCSQELGEILSFKVINHHEGGWRAYPPIQTIDKRSIYTLILTQYDNKDKYELKRTVEVEFAMR